MAANSGLFKKLDKQNARIQCLKQTTSAVGECLLYSWSSQASEMVQHHGQWMNWHWGWKILIVPERKTHFIGSIIQVRSRIHPIINIKKKPRHIASKQHITSTERIRPSTTKTSTSKNYVKKTIKIMQCTCCPCLAPKGGTELGLRLPAGAVGRGQADPIFWFFYFLPHAYFF
jgi:hypothetical protein